MENNSCKKMKKLVNQETDKQPGPADQFKDMPFTALRTWVSENTLKTVAEMGFNKMTEIQAKAIPPLLVGYDVMAHAKTGSGKTLAFLLPVVELMNKLEFTPNQGTGCIIISPTREICVQTYNLVKTLTSHNPQTCGLLIGGTNRKSDVKDLKKGVNIIVATPGRLFDHLQNTKNFVFNNLKCLVIDEADKILQKGFETVLRRIIDYLPKKRQTMLFSATTTSETDALVKLALKKKPVIVREEAVSQQATADGLEQGYIICPQEKKFMMLFCVLKKFCKKKVIVFYNSRHTVEYHCKFYNFTNPNFCMAMHGKQKQTKRTNTYLQFCEAPKGILLCTDVAARGLDFPSVDWIIQYDPPTNPKEYIHRVGRTARGARGRGKAVLVLRPEELEFLPYLEQARVPVKEYEFSWDKVADIQLQLENLVNKDKQLNELARKAFIGYVRAYNTHLLKKVFDVATLNLTQVAKSFGFSEPPSVCLQKLTFVTKYQQRKKKVHEDSGLKNKKLQN